MIRECFRVLNDVVATLPTAIQVSVLSLFSLISYSGKRQRQLLSSSPVRVSAEKADSNEENETVR